MSIIQSTDQDSLATGKTPTATRMAYLADNHRQLIDESAVSEAILAQRGYWTATKKSQLSELGFGRSQQRTPALVIPIHGVHGSVVLHQIRPDSPREKDGKKLKYETPHNARMAVDVPPAARPDIDDPKIPLFITEGARKADAAVSKGLCCIGLLGVWNFRGTNSKQGKTVLADWESIALNDRKVYIAYDSDVMSKQGVFLALKRISEFLKSRGAIVTFIYLPVAKDGGKVGLDDFFASGKTVDDLLCHSSASLIQPTTIQKVQPSPYAMHDDGFYWFGPAGYQQDPVRLSNFTATITCERALDDDIESFREFEITCKVSGREILIRVRADEFDAMAWPTTMLGSGAVVMAGRATRDHLRVAILDHSDSTIRKTIYTHLGWRRISGEWVYLSAAGTNGTAGTPTTADTSLPAPLMSATLPATPNQQELAAAIRATLRLTEGLTSDEIAFTLISLVFRAAINRSDFTVCLVGESGTFKTELATLCQQFFGEGYNSRNLPANWSNTANFNRSLAFSAKDSLLVVDDFVPGGTSQDRAKLQRNAEELLRGQGNAAGRGRMNANATLQTQSPPRTTILMTAEELPQGQSLRSRMLVLEISRRSVDVEALTEMQELARQGRFSACMAGYVAFLAPNIRSIRTGLSKRSEDLRATIDISIGHARIPETLAQLLIGIDHFLKFAEESEAISSEERHALLQRGRRALTMTGAGQNEDQRRLDPCQQFLEFLRSAILSGVAHIASLRAPTTAQSASSNFRSGYPEHANGAGSRVGWAKGDEVYLDPRSAFRVASRFASDCGESFTLGFSTLGKRLQDNGILLASEKQRGRATTRKSIGGKRVGVWVVDRSSLFPKEDVPAVPTGPDRSTSDAKTPLRDYMIPSAVSAEDSKAPAEFDRTTHDKESTE
ncbi:MAG: DUF3854 domain-containing protein [Planctomycetota bacterium]